MSVLTRDDIIKLVREATDGTVVDYDFTGKPITNYDALMFSAYAPAVERIVNLAIAADRERREFRDGLLALKWHSEGFEAGFAAAQEAMLAATHSRPGDEKEAR